MSHRPTIVTITTDFGTRDAYVAAIKGVILTRAPFSTLIDVTHEIPPQNVQHGALVLRAALPYFPHGCIHVAVVDPGVGTERKAIAVQTQSAWYVGPDNGLFALVLADCGAMDNSSGRLKNAAAVELTNEEYHLLPRVSRTFHGRDIFAPAAAAIAGGVEISELGAALSSILPLHLNAPKVVGSRVTGEVTYVDGYGNAITNIPGDILPLRARVSIRDLTIDGVSVSYADADVVALVSSSGTLEIAVRNDSAAKRYGLRPGDPVTVDRAV